MSRNHKRKDRGAGAALAVAVFLAVAAAASIVALLVFRGRADAFVDAVGPNAQQASTTDSTGNASDAWSNGEYRSLDLSNIEFSASNEDEMREVVDSVGTALGVSDAYKGLDSATISELDGATYYRFPQRLNGVPVLGRSVVGATDSSSGVAALSGNAAQMDSSVVEPKVSEADAQAAIEAYMAQTFEGAANLLVDDLSGDDLVYYSFDAEGGYADPVLAWETSVAYTVDESVGSLDLIVSAEDATVLCAGDSQASISLEGMLQTREIEVDDYEGDGSTTPLTSTVFGTAEDGTTIRVYQPKTGAWFGDEVTRFGVYWWWRDDNGNLPYAQAIMAGENDTASKQGVDAVYALTKTLEYYRNYLGRNSYDDEGADITVFTNISKRPAKEDTYDPDNPEKSEDYNNNATWWGGADCIYVAKSSNHHLGNIGILPADDYTATDDIAIFAHEFTHAVVYKICSMGQATYSSDNEVQPIGYYEVGALNEGFADVIGLAVRAHSVTGETVASMWQLPAASRDATNPGAYSGYLTTYQDFEADYAKDNKVEEHNGATVLSHTAYLIWQDWVKYGDPEDLAYMDRIAKLFYQALFLLPCDPSFSDACAAVIAAGQIMMSNNQLSQAQFDAIERAFESQGIEPTQEKSVLVDRTAALFVMDVNAHAYGNYHLKLSKAGSGDVVCSLDVVVDDSGADGKIPYVIGDDVLEQGTSYVLTVSDLADSGAPDVSIGLQMVNDGNYSGSYHYEANEKEYSIIQLATGFGSTNVTPISVTRADVTQDIALVLDVSGSMEGEPLESVRSAVGEFIDVAEQDGLNVGLVTFSSSASELCELSGSGYDSMREAISSEEFSADGGTNIEAGLSTARVMLGSGSADAQTIVLMTDGLPTEGKGEDDLVDYANTLKAAGYNLYTLGFFNALSGDELVGAQDLLERMATQGEHFEATGTNLEDFFTAIANQLSGARYTYIRVACPVDVTVVSEGQVLTSCAPDEASTSDFGSISYVSAVSSGDGEEEQEGASESDQVKLVRLLQGRDYQIWLTGTGTGVMDYSVSFMDGNGDYVDERSFTSVPISGQTRIQSSSAQTTETVLSIDSDGDGVTDERWRASSGSDVEVQTREQMSALRKTVLAVGAVAVLALVALFEWRSRKKVR